MLVALFALLFDFAGVRFCVGVILVRVALVICVACGGRRVCVCGVFVFECAARPFEFVVICVAFALPLCPVMSLKCVLLGFVHCSASPLGDRVLAAVSAKVSAAGPGVVDEAVGVALARVLSDEGLHDNEAMCDRDYSVPCPEGWVDRGDGGSCSPPIGYVGPCSEVDLRGLPPLDKAKAAASCLAAFPCNGACAPDFGQLCPDGWVSSGSGSCAAPAAYSGPCVAVADFGRVGAAGKAAFSQACGVRWACGRAPVAPVVPSGGCEMDFAPACPSGWSGNGGVCSAPRGYAGPCSVLWVAGAWSDVEKRVVASRCEVQWPCAA